MPTRVSSLCVGCLAILFGVQVHAQIPATCERAIQIGAWNIQWLGNAIAGKRTAQTPEDVASYIAAGKVDVLGLAEITASATLQTGEGRNTTLDETFKVLNATGGKWKYTLFPKRPGARAPQDQWTGIAWNESVVALTGGPWKLDVEVDVKREADIRKKFDKPEAETIVLSRWPYAAKFSAGVGKTDFVVVPVHLKSNIGGAATAAARAYEVELILSGLNKLKTTHADEDLVLLGDTNMLLASEQAGAAMAKAGFKDCNASDLGTHLPFKPGEKAVPFDRVFLMKNQPETKNSCSINGDGKGSLDFKVISPSEWRPDAKPADFRQRLSDHLMVRAGICVNKDDD